MPDTSPPPERILSRQAQRRKELRAEADKYGLRQISIFVPGRDYARLWKQLGKTKTNVRWAIDAERKCEAARLSREAQNDSQMELVGVGGLQ